MTPGQAALAEAMRLEQARIYGRTLTQASTVEPAAMLPAVRRPSTRDFDLQVQHLRSRGETIARIALRLGCGKQRVTTALERLRAAS